MDAWDVLLSIGLREDGDVHGSGYSLDLGHFKLWAVRAPNRWFVDVIQIHGVICYRSGGRLDGLTEVEGQIPAIVESREEALAYLVSTLDRHSQKRRFVSAQPLPWVEEGRAHLNLVPWERDLIEARERQARYQAAARCWVDRDWLRLALRHLRRAGETAEAGHVAVMFDGTSLSFECAGERHLMTARGQPWPDGIRVCLEHFMQRVRLTSLVEVCVLDQVLLIGRYSYPLAQPVAGGADEGEHVT